MRRLAIAALLPALLCLFALGAASASAAAPTIAQTTVTGVGTDSAVLRAQVDPGGKPTLYRFEYGLADCATSACTKVPSPEGKIPATITATGDLKEKETTITNVSVGEGAFAVGDVISGPGIPPSTTVVLVNLKAKTLLISSEPSATAAGAALTATGPQPISTPIGGLSPGTTYHFRVVARNSEGEIPGPDRTFTTHVPAFAGLPDARRYEQASPVQKNATDARGTLLWVKAADHGNAVSFLSSNGLPGGVGQQDVPAYLASRSASGWSTLGLLPRAALGSQAAIRGWLPDFSAVFEQVSDQGVEEDTIFLERSADGSVKEVLRHGDGLGNFSYAGASADGSEVLFEAAAKLACCPKALEGVPNLYLWERDSGQIRLVDVLNDQAPPPAGAVAGPYDWMKSQPLPLVATGGGGADGYYTQDPHAISADGKAIYFTARGSGTLYVRLNPSAPPSPLSGGKCTKPDLLACTVALSVSQRSPLDPAGQRPAAFMWASADGKAAFFTSPEELTEDANTGPEQPPPAIQRAATSGPPIAKSFPITASGIAKDAEHIYWVNPLGNSIGRSGPEGEAPDPSFIAIPPLKVENTEGETEEVAAKPQYVALDGEHVYWSSEGEGNKGEGTIGRAKINGEAASIEGEWIKGITRPKGIAVDAEYAYWAKAGGGEGTIGRAKKSDPGSPEQEFIKTSFGEMPEGVAVDAGHIYWTMNFSDGTGLIARNELKDGTNRVTLGVGGAEGLRGIAVDSTSLYWAGQKDGAIGRIALADIPGSGASECAPIPSCNRQLIPVAGKPKGLLSDGTNLLWSLNGEIVPNPGNDLYRFGAQGEQLEDLTAAGTATNGAEVVGVLGAAKDGGRIYFAANGDLDGAGEAEAGNCKGSFFAYSGRCNLYLAQETAPGKWSTAFIAPLDADGTCETSDAANWLAKGGVISGDCRPEKTALVSADGGVLLFRSHERLSAYDNEGMAELYRYDAGAKELGCVSCNPTGEAPSGSARLGSIGLTAFAPEAVPSYVLPRNLSADGKRVFFESTDALVANDTNAAGGCDPEGSAFFPFRSCQDVYEWEAAGSGSCEAATQAGGCLYLLSSGTTPKGSFFADASLSGDDAFIATRSGLVLQDQDQLQDVYDARVGGGLASQNQPPAPECESPDGCHGAPSPQPAAATPPSAAFSGPANKKHAHKGAKKRKHAKKHKHKKQRPAKQENGGKAR